MISKNVSSYSTLSRLVVPVGEVALMISKNVYSYSTLSSLVVPVGEVADSLVTLLPFRFYGFTFHLHAMSMLLFNDICVWCCA